MSWITSRISESGLLRGSSAEPPHFSKRSEFALEIYKLLRAEIMEYITAIRNLEFGCIAGMSAAYYFIFNALLSFDSGKALLNRTLLLGLLFLPVFLPAFCLIKLRSYFTQMRLISVYLQTIEESFQKEGFWEVFLAESRRQNNISFYMLGWSSLTAFWLLLIAGLAIPIFAIHTVK